MKIKLTFVFTLFLSALTASASAAFLTSDGDFNAQTVPNPIGAPWLSGEGPRNAETASQSPFVNVFADNVKGMNIPATAANPHIVSDPASIPTLITSGLVYFNADFRSNTPDTGDYSLVVTQGSAGAQRTSALYVTGNTFTAENGAGADFTLSIAEDTWYNVQLALNVTTGKYSGKLTPFGGASVPIPTQTFVVNNGINNIYTDGGTSLVAGTAPNHDIDNFTLSSTPLAAASHNANKALRVFEQSTSGAVAGVNGDWQYGTAPSIGGAFTIFPASEHSDSIPLASTPASALQGWYERNALIVPAVGVNVTGASFDSVCCGTYDADEIWMHSGATGRDFAIVRWTAPISGLIDYSATFINESAGAGEGVFVLINGTSVFSGTSAGSDLASGTTANGFSLFVTAGTTIDFVATGFASTGLFADVSYVPEPSSLVLIALGLVGAAFARRRGTRR